MLKGKMALKDANAAYAASGLQEGHRQIPGGARSTTRTCHYAYFYLAQQLRQPVQAGEEGAAENDANLTKAVEYYKKAAEKITEPEAEEAVPRVPASPPTDPTS